MDIILKEMMNDEDFADRIRWDLTPRDIMKPSYSKPVAQRPDLSGLMFYVESAGDEGPVLSVMKVSETITRTLGEVPAAPEELLKGAMGAGLAGECAGMYPIDAALTSWIKDQLGIKGG